MDSPHDPKPLRGHGVRCPLSGFRVRVSLGAADKITDFLHLPYTDKNGGEEMPEFDTKIRKRTQWAERRRVR